MIKIPQDLTFSQTNTGEYSGNILQTKNISFDNEGLITLEKRTRAVFDSLDYSFLDDGTIAGPIKFIHTSGSTIYFLCTGGIGVITIGASAPYKPTLTVESTTGVPVLDSVGENDGVWFNSALCIVNATDSLFTFDGDEWTERDFTNIATILTVFENKQQLAMAGNNIITLVDKTWNEQTILTLPSNYYVTSMDWNNNRLYIGTLDYDTQEAILFEWDGSSADAIGYKINSQTILSVKRYKNGVAVLTMEGELLYVNGGIERIGVLPIFNKKQWYTEANTSASLRPVQNYGMFVDNEYIYIAVNSTYSPVSLSNQYDNYDNYFPSGVWCYDPKVGLTHKFSVGVSKEERTNSITTANVATATGIITVAGRTVPDTGTPVFYDDGGSGANTYITPLEFFKRYFVIKLSDTTLKLATTKSNAIAGTNIVLTGTGNNNQSLIFCQNADFGGAKESPRTITYYKRSNNSTFVPQIMSSFLIASKKSTRTTGNIYSIDTIVSDQENRGYIITPRIKSPNIEDEFRSLILRFKPLINPEDKIIVKYRTTKPTLALRKLYSNSVKGTFVNSTSFTTTKLTDVSVGDEVEIVSGAGAGYLAHITDIVLDAGTYTVTIDETVENIAASDTFYFVVDNWTKVETLTSASFDNFEIGIGKNSKWIQFKIELRGIDVKIEDLLIYNTKSR
jgi:hypothetical protein